MFHGDDGTVWQSGYAADVGDEKFSSAGSVGSAGDRVLIITDDAMDPLVWQGAMAAINEKGRRAGVVHVAAAHRTATKIPGSAAVRWRSV